jgi:hypothetical protein
MARVTNEWKVLRIKEKVRVVREIENGKKKADTML